MISKILRKQTGKCTSAKDGFKMDNTFAGVTRNTERTVTRRANAFLPDYLIVRFRLKNPCSSAHPCVPAYSFHNDLPLTSEITAFVNKVKNVTYSSNLDNPEGGLDAMMQAIVCQVGFTVVNCLCFRNACGLNQGCESGSAKILPLPLPHRLFDLESNLAKTFCPFPNVD